MRGKILFAQVLLLSLLVVSVGCSGSGSEEEAAAEQSAALYTELEQLHGELTEMKTEIDELETRLVAAAEETEAEVDEAVDTEALVAEIDELRDETKEQANALYTKIVEYLNSANIVEGQELTEQQSKAFDMKAELDIDIAQEYIHEGGDYQKAINIYTQALRNNPNNQLLLDAKDEAERLQYMDEERFAQAKKGMSQEQVRILLGTVKHTNVRDFTDRGRVGWFYRKEDGGAAGVYFKETKKDSGDWQVEITDYDAVKPPSGEEAAEG